MKTLISLMLMFTGFALNAQNSEPCAATLTEEYIKSVDLIAFAYLDSVQNKAGVYKMKVKNLLVGKSPGEDITIAREQHINLDPCYVYLIYASRIDSVHAEAFEIKTCSRTGTLRDRVSSGDYHFITKLPKGIMATGACERGATSEDVCGCDGYTYPNRCEAMALGIVRCTKGPCKGNPNYFGH
jgi:hypothetical protein